MNIEELYKIIEFLGTDAKLNDYERKYLDDISEKKNLTDKQNLFLEKIKTIVKKSEVDYAYGSVKRLVEAIQNSGEKSPFTKFEHDFLNSIKDLKILSEKQAHFLNSIKSKSWVCSTQFKGKKFEHIFTHEGLAMSKQIKADAEAGLQKIIAFAQIQYDAKQQIV